MNGPRHRRWPGSAHLATGTNGDESAQIRNTGYAGTKLSDLTALSYSTYASDWNGQQLPYLTLNVDSDNDGTLDDQLFFEPPFQTPTSGNPLLPDQGAEMLDTWQTWNALAGGWYSDTFASPGTGVLPLADYIAAHPDAVILTPAGPGGVRLVVACIGVGRLRRNVIIRSSRAVLDLRFRVRHDTDLRTTATHARMATLPSGTCQGTLIVHGRCVQRRMQRNLHVRGDTDQRGRSPTTETIARATTPAPGSLRWHIGHLRGTPATTGRATELTRTVTPTNEGGSCDDDDVCTHDDACLRERARARPRAAVPLYHRRLRDDGNPVRAIPASRRSRT